MEIKLVTDQMFDDIDTLVRDAFTKSSHGYEGEAELTVALRQSETPTIELAAVDGDVVLGHALLSEATIGKTKGLVLAPLSVHTAHQNEGIGSTLMDALDEIAVDNDYAFISILGDAYYTQFGYVPAADMKVVPPMDIPSEYFHLKAFGPVDAGTLVYAPEFGI
ncbi:GNAT family N-acetyltransferase [Weissella tructae]|uniref:GNAT family acetyltransferase n=2 Tax=Weissella TaxID=46255 RepID=A0A075TVI5_9LACO|nr:MULTISPECIES: N-acetyltransferase [Weissella]AIG65574.1 GNAT family acetyltransferase [Weissella tructae]AIM62889.1 GNAT family acetyltransferase [Weissella ceti]AIM64287.1 GNAT family acetyltransferase [Weissella ceti]ELA06968.1 putative acetyltransferase [Weissella ceti NC36]QVV90706.1 N-acetyltransferase [Weissella tructae]